MAVLEVVINENARIVFIFSGFCMANCMNSFDLIDFIPKLANPVVYIHIASRSATAVLSFCSANSLCLSILRPTAATMPDKYLQQQGLPAQLVQGNSGVLPSRDCS